MATDLSLLTRTRNRPVFLSRLAHTVIGQTAGSQGRFCWVVVNDGGARKPVEDICRRARSSGVPVSLHHTDAPEGLSRPQAAQAGLERVDTDWFVLLDDDEQIMPCAVELWLETAARWPEAAGVALGVARQAERLAGDQIKPIGKPETLFSSDLPLKLIDVAYRNPLPPAGLMLKTALVRSVGGYDPRWPVLEDWDLLLKVLLRSDVVCRPDTVVTHSRRPKATGDSANSDEALHKIYDTLIRNHHLRQDIERATLGLGHLMNIHDRVAHERLSRLLSLLAALPFGKKR